MELIITPHLEVDVDAKTGDLVSASVYVPELMDWINCTDRIKDNNYYLEKIVEKYNHELNRRKQEAI